MLPYGRKNPLPFPFSKRSPVSGLRQTRKQRETGVKRVETVGVYPLAPPRGAARSRRPQTANPPLRFSGKLPARKGRTRLRQFAYPGFPVQKRSRPERANTLTQFAHPGQPVLKKLPPRSGEPPARFVCPA